MTLLSPEENDMTPVERRNELLGAKVAENLEKRGFEACYVATAAEAKEKALSYIGKDDVISWGGCISAEEAGLIGALKSGGYPNVKDRHDAKSPEEREKLTREAFFADVYIGGANAISMDGQIVNIDGSGNRVAAMTFGPKSVIIIASTDKIAATVEDAVARARMVAAPTNVQRFQTKKTPCLVNGCCSDCLSPDGICNYFQIIRHCPGRRIKVILVGEKLGF